jgi:hypothetical protein
MFRYLFRPVASTRVICDERVERQCFCFFLSFLLQGIKIRHHQIVKLHDDTCVRIYLCIYAVISLQLT